jgi:nucleoside-diphosphate-sugar epimerase
MNVVITGPLGFVGSHLAPYLAGRGVEVWALGRTATAAPVGGRQAANDRRADSYARVFEWQRLEDIPWREVDAVIHLAGKAHDTSNTSEERDYFAINVGLTERLLAAIRVHDRSGRPAPLRFMLFSSVKAAADRVEGVLTETTPPTPQTPYGRSKLAAEAAVAQAAVAGVVDPLILRPCMIHGPGNKGNLTLLHGIVQRGIPWPLGSFKNRRSFASIGNVCAVVEALLQGMAPAGIYQVADDEPLATTDVVRLMAHAMRRSARIWSLPPAWVRVAARLGDHAHLPLNSERLKKLTEPYVVSNAALKAALVSQHMRERPPPP